MFIAKGLWFNNYSLLFEGSVLCLKKHRQFFCRTIRYNVSLHSYFIPYYRYITILCSLFNFNKLMSYLCIPPSNTFNFFKCLGIIDIKPAGGLLCDLFGLRVMVWNYQKWAYINRFNPATCPRTRAWIPAIYRCFFVVLSDFWVMSDFANIGKLLKLCFHNLQFIYLNIITELITILL